MGPPVAGRSALLAAAVLLCLSVVSSQEDCPPEEACRSSPGEPLCFGKGDCVCGRCECRHQEIRGQFCECDDTICPRFSNVVCAGPDHGRCQCGACYCHPGWTGEACECPTSNHTCVDPGTGSVCNNKGSCVCGQCECRDQEIRGQFCECDDTICPRFSNVVCAGPDHGRCQCGACYCHPGWTGEACECPTSNHTCVDPGTGSVCNNKGSCECGRCRCHQSAGESYSGEYCEQCPTCSSRCGTYRSCAECLAYRTGPLADRCDAACRRVSVQLVDRPAVSGPDDRLCRFSTEDGCMFQFVYGPSGSPLRVQRRRSCPQPVAPPKWLGGGAGAAAASAVTVLTTLCAAVYGW